MKKVLFVCLGNICRSPMAEAVLRHKIQAGGWENKIAVDSAGTGGWHAGKKPHEGTQKLLQRQGIRFDGMTARQIRKQDLTEFDYILAMDSDNLKVIRQMAEDTATKTATIQRLLDYLPESGLSDVPDPYYTGNFDEVYRLIDPACDRLLAHIQKG